MKMVDYLIEIEHAASTVISTIWAERKRYENLEAEIAKLKPRVQNEYRRAASMQYDAEDADDVMLGVGIHWANYFGPDKDLHAKKVEAEDLEAKLTTRRFSLEALSGSVLQFAKQGISLVHGNLKKCPNGRTVGRQPLKDVVWQGRNQALHWEEGTLKPPAESCFIQLQKDFHPAFTGFSDKSMAFEVVRVLGWGDFQTFHADMMLMA